MAQHGTIGYADGADVSAAVGRLTADELRVVAEHVRDEQLRNERRLLVDTLGGLPDVDPTAAHVVDAARGPMVVADPRRWLLPTPPHQLATVAGVLLAVTRRSVVPHPLAFRLIVAPAANGSLYNYPGTVIGAKSVYPIDVDELRDLAAQGGIPIHPGQYVQEVARCTEALIRSSRAALAARAVDGTRQAPPLSEMAHRELREARGTLAAITPEDIVEPLRAVAGMVAEELAGTDTGALALEADEAYTRSVSGPRLHALEAATQAAALQPLVHLRGRRRDVPRSRGSHAHMRVVPAQLS